MSQEFPSIAFLICTIGRPTLKNTLTSLKDQVIIGQDRIYCVFDGKCEKLDIFQEFMYFGETLRLIMHPENLGAYGHGLRNFYQGRLEGDYIQHFDDDDEFEPDCIPLVRERLKANWGWIVINSFYNHVGKLVGEKHLLNLGEIGTPSAMWPNRPDRFAPWPMYYGGDSEFYQQTIKNFGGEDKVTFTDIVIMRASPQGRLEGQV